MFPHIITAVVAVETSVAQLQDKLTCRWLVDRTATEPRSSSHISHNFFSVILGHVRYGKKKKNVNSFKLANISDFLRFGVPFFRH